METATTLQEYTRLYKAQMLKILLSAKVLIPDDSKDNIVTLSYYMRKNHILENLPVLENILKALADKHATDEFKLSMLKENYDTAFIPRKNYANKSYTVKIREYQRWVKLYISQTRSLLKRNGVFVPEEMSGQSQELQGRWRNDSTGHT